MRLSRALGKSICRGLIGVLLFAQFAVSSYACPRLAETADSGLASTATVTMEPMKAAPAKVADMPPGCDQMDQDAANLCAEHCRHGQQSFDSAAAPAVQAAIPTLLYLLVVEPVNTPGLGRSFPAPDANVTAVHPPPHAILHCVFRI